MWRFLLAGMITVAGVVLLFVASFGDPSTALRRLRTLVPVAQTTVSVKATTPPSPPQAAKAEVDAASLERQRDELRKQVQGLQTKMAEASRDVTLLRSNADKARQELDALHQQQAADLTASDRTRQAAQQEMEAREARLAEAERQVAEKQAAADRLKSEAERTRTQSETPKDVNPPPLAHVEVPTPPSPPAAQPAPAVSAERQPAPAKLAANTAPAPTKPAPVKPSSGAPDSLEPVLNKLRQATPEKDQASQDTSQDRPGASRPQPQAYSSRDRLFDARAALAAGRIEEGRNLLEQAQVQLVLRPIRPADGAASSSVAAGQVAEALSMLGAGDVYRALRYIDLAMAQASSSQTDGPQPVVAGMPSRNPVPTSYDHGYGNAPDYRYTDRSPAR